MNGWTVVGFVVGVAVGGLFGVLTASLLVAAARADAAVDRMFLDEIGRVD